MRKKDTGKALLFVTDYTSRTDLAPVAATAEWTHGITADRILKIALSDEAVEVLEKKVARELTERPSTEPPAA